MFFMFTRGERLRNFAEKEGNLAALLAKSKMKAGGLLPSFLAVWLWSGALIEGVKGKQQCDNGRVAQNAFWRP